MVAVYPEFVEEMEKRKLTRTSIAKGIGISTRTLYSKLVGDTDFTLSEANAIHAAFFPDVDMWSLFARAEQQSAHKKPPSLSG